MSAVRMCDRCGRIFSEREENWTTFIGAQQRRDPGTNQMKSVTQQMDTCGDCSTGSILPPLHVGPAAINGPKAFAAGSDKPAAKSTVIDGRDNDGEDW